MFKQLNAGIVSLGLMSTMTAPVMAQNAFNKSTEANSVPTNSLLVEQGKRKKNEAVICY